MQTVKKKSSHFYLSLEILGSNLNLFSKVIDFENSVISFQIPVFLHFKIMYHSK